MSGDDRIQRQLNALTREVHELSQRIEALTAALNDSPRMYDEPDRADSTGRPFAPGTGPAGVVSDSYTRPATGAREAVEAALDRREAET